MADTGREKPLTVTHVMAAPGVMSAAIFGRHLLFVGHGLLWAADISDPARPELVGEAHFFGAGRQIATENGVAYVTARTEGLYVIDVRDSAHPRVVAHYDTIELATGVAVHGDLLLVAQRQYGVEIVDVSDPARPRFISKIRTGEAQSVTVHGRHAYVGDWGTQQVTTIDIANPRAPQISSQTDLDGYGDGVFVQGDYLYASTGHHARGGGFFRAKDAPGYGGGHGLEILSLADPTTPVVLSRVKFPKLFQRGAHDMWNAVVSGSHAFCADTHNGVFVVDVSDPGCPETVARHEELVGGLAVGDGYVYAACPKKGLVVLDAAGMAGSVASEKGRTIGIPPVPARQPEDHRVYSPGGQIRALGFIGEYAAVAAGMQGVHILQLWPEVREVLHIETRGFALHLDAQGGRIYVSEGPFGLSIWEHAGSGRFEPRCRYEDPGKRSIRHALVDAQGRYAVAETAKHFSVIDLSDPAGPRQIFEREVAIIYGDQTSHGLVADRYMCVSDHCTPIRWLDLGARVSSGIDTGVDLAATLSFFDGAAALGDRLLVTSEGGYRLAEPLSSDLDQTPLYHCGKHLRGKPWVYGNGLYIVSRNHSRVAIVDISDLENPRFLREIETAGNPSIVAARGSTLLVADGYGGLLIYDDFVNVLGLDVDERAWLPTE